MDDAEVTLEDLVLSYMNEAVGRGRHNHHPLDAAG
jgi:hypothetical protein